jgi:hypothetical protein
MFYSRLLLYAKLVPAKERMLVVARSYFSGISALLRPSVLVHASVFTACAKAIFLTVNFSATPGNFTGIDFESFFQYATCNALPLQALIRFLNGSS